MAHDEGSRAGAELDAAAVLDDEAAKFSSLRMLSEYFQSRKHQQQNNSQGQQHYHAGPDGLPISSSGLSATNSLVHSGLPTDEDLSKHPSIPTNGHPPYSSLLSTHDEHSIYNPLSSSGGGGGYPPSLSLVSRTQLVHHPSMATIPTAVILGTPDALISNNGGSTKDLLLTIPENTTTSTISSVVVPPPSLLSTRTATGKITSEETNNATLPPSTVGGGPTVTIPPSPPKQLQQITPVLLPTRIGGDKIEWLELNVSSPAAFQRISLGTDMLSEEGKAACESIYRAIQLRNKHFVCRKPDYYMGSYTIDEGTTTVSTGSYGSLNTLLSSPHKNGINSPHHSGHHTHHRQNSILNLNASVPSSPKAGLPDNANMHNVPYIPPPELPKSPLLEKLFHRRRPSPKFTPFTLPILPKAEYEYDMVDGVVQVYHKQLKPLPVPSSLLLSSAGTSPVQQLNIRTPSIGLDVDGLHSPSGGYNVPLTDEASLIHPPKHNIFPVPTWTEFSKDYEELLKIIHSPPVKTFAFRRLELLAARFGLHVQLNAERESHEQKVVPHRDFYNVRKCDTHVHHSAAMNQKHLLRFIKNKLKKESETIVIRRDGKDLTLAQVFESLNLTAYDLSIDTLDMHADWTTFHRFDRFNNKYNPVGASRLREIFLKTDNYLCGRFLAEITREIFDDLEASKYQLAEYRLSIYGRSPTEWRKLASWIVNNRLASPTVRWMIQIPRLYETYMQAGQIKSFQDMLDNIFLPLFEVTIDPSVDPLLHQFLGIVCGIDSVDDESRVEPASIEEYPIPALYTKPEQPPYHYWTFYLAQNIAVLNKLRALRGLTQFSFRPHCGEAGNVEHLASGFLTAESINHGINLRRSPVLQYLYYLTQIGIAMSPLSNNRLFLEYTKNPFQDFFQKGLNVSLSTDDPLMLSYTKEPLLEEYAVATQVWRLSSADMCEIARNSVLQCGWEYPWKAHYLGPDYAEPGPEGNDVHYTNVPHIRLQYRLETLRTEQDLIHKGVTSRHAVLHRVPSNLNWVGPSASTFFATTGNTVVRSATDNHFILSTTMTTENNNSSSSRGKSTNIGSSNAATMNSNGNNVPSTRPVSGNDPTITTGTTNGGTSITNTSTKPPSSSVEPSPSNLKPMIVNNNIRRNSNSKK